MREFIERQVKIKGYGSTSEYISHPIAAEQEREAEKSLEVLLVEGLENIQIPGLKKECNVGYYEWVVRNGSRVK